MFDLTPTPGQQAAIDGVAARHGDVRSVARESGKTGGLPVALRSDLARLIGAEEGLVRDGRSALLDPVGMMLVAEELGRADAGTAFDIIGAVQGALVVAACGRSAMIGTTGPSGLLPLAMYEGFGRSPSDWRTRATETGNGWILDGRKDSVIGASHSSSLLVCARREGGVGLGAFVVETPGSGITIERDDRKEGKLGLALAATAAVEFTGVRLRPEDCISDGVDAPTIHRAVNVQRLVVAAISIGVGQASVDASSTWVAQRKVRGRSLAKNQGVSFPIVDAAIAVSRARLLVWDVASRIGEMSDVAEMGRRVGRAVAIGCTAGTQAARLGVNLMGWHGLSQTHLAEMRYRDAAVLSAIDFDVMNHASPTVEAI